MQKSQFFLQITGWLFSQSNTLNNESELSFVCFKQLVKLQRKISDTWVVSYVQQLCITFVSIYRVLHITNIHLMEVALNSKLSISLKSTLHNMIFCSSLQTWLARAYFGIEYVSPTTVPLVHSSLIVLDLKSCILSNFHYVNTNYTTSFSSTTSLSSLFPSPLLLTLNNCFEIWL